MKRKGLTYRLHDFTLPTIGGHTFTLTVGIDPMSYAGTFKPEAFANVVWRRPRKDMTGWSASCTHVETHHRKRITLPHVTFARGYQLRRFGGVPLSNATYRFYRAVGR